MKTRSLFQARPALLNLAAAVSLALLLSCQSATAGASDADQRAQALLGQMTLDEKIGQMVQADLSALHDKADIAKYFLGSVLSGGDSDPPNGDNSVGAWKKVVDECEAQALNTRLKIPILYGIDVVHGHNNVVGAVIFPHHIGLGATRNPQLMERVGRVEAEEMLATDAQWAFGPCIAVARNERWGRTYESFGETPELVQSLGAGEVRGLQGARLGGAGSVLACAKHFLGDGGTQDGIDQGNDVFDEATLRKVHLPGYVDAVKAGVGSIMVSYSSWNGVKMSGNTNLLTGVLKGELGFQGFLVSDWAAIDQLSSDYKKDIESSANAGMDMFMIPTGAGQKNNYQEFIKDLKELVTEGKVPQSRIDDAVRRILRVKFQMGLIDSPAGSKVDYAAAFGSPEHRAVAREAVRQSLVLLKNDKKALPLSKRAKRIVVIGSAADDIGTQCGGWTITWQGKPGLTTQGGTTILQAIKKTAGSSTVVDFSADGANLAGADAAVVVVGEQPYAEMKGDRTSLDLAASDAALIKKAHDAGVPVVTVLISGRPLVLGAALDSSDALVAAWLPGTEGQGVADVLFGDFKPTGKLPRAWPRNNQQLSADLFAASNQPQFTYGFGLTY